MKKFWSSKSVPCRLHCPNWDQDTFLKKLQKPIGCFIFAHISICRENHPLVACVFSVKLPIARFWRNWICNCMVAWYWFSLYHVVCYHLNDFALFQGISEFETYKDLLYSHLCELRVFKTPEEIEVIRYANKISSEAHREVMRNMQPNSYEYQYESLFQHHVYAKGEKNGTTYAILSYPIYKMERVNRARHLKLSNFFWRHCQSNEVSKWKQRAIKKQVNETHK